jgi:uncharacterized MAPEG superfamily protein
MDAATMASSPFIAFTAWSVVILVAHIMLQANSATRDLGMEWNAGPRDDDKKPTSAFAGRAARASANFRETYPAFIGLALGLAIADPHSGWGILGASIWFVCRLVYIPLYLFGVPYIRSLCWVGSLGGLAIMFLTLVF